MAAKVYIETTIPSYLTGRPSRDLLIAGHQQVTHEWWEDRRHDFELYVSQLVEDECRGGDSDMAEKRLNTIRGIPLLEIYSRDMSGALNRQSFVLPWNY